jgi:hypothetical protein
VGLYRLADLVDANARLHDLAVWDDDWTAVTLDGRRTAQFEHSLLVTADGVENLTIGSDGRIPAEVFAERAMGRPEAGVGGASTPGLQLP